MLRLVASVLLSLGLAAAVLLPLGGARAAEPSRALQAAVQAQRPPYSGPIVDTHAHLEAEIGVGIEPYMALYDQTGVKGGWMMGVPWMLATEAWERYPDRVVPFLAEQYTETIGPQSVYRNHAALRSEERR